jgi:hypothetical protein
MHNPDPISIGQKPMSGMTPTASSEDVEFGELVLDEKLGAGSYGVVYRATFRGETVAVKVRWASATLA